MNSIINNNSMNGIISFDDGNGGVLSNGSLNCKTFNSENLSTNNLNSNSINNSGNINSNTITTNDLNILNNSTVFDFGIADNAIIGNNLNVSQNIHCGNNVDCNNLKVNNDAYFNGSTHYKYKIIGQIFYTNISIPLMQSIPNISMTYTNIDLTPVLTSCIIYLYPYYMLTFYDVNNKILQIIDNTNGTDILVTLVSLTTCFKIIICYKYIPI